MKASAESALQIRNVRWSLDFGGRLNWLSLFSCSYLSVPLEWSHFYPVSKWHPESKFLFIPDICKHFSPIWLPCQHWPIKFSTSKFKIYKFESFSWVHPIVSIKFSAKAASSDVVNATVWDALLLKVDLVGLNCFPKSNRIVAKNQLKWFLWFMPSDKCNVISKPMQLPLISRTRFFWPQLFLPQIWGLELEFV